MPVGWVESGRLSELAADAGYDAEMITDRLTVLERHGL
jgi:hypothetical protein